MTENAHKGETVLNMNGKDYLVVYDWEALAKLQTLLGPDFDKKIATATTELDVATLANILSLGLQRHNAVTAEAIKDMSPPLISVSTAIIHAINRAFYGNAIPEGREAPDSPDENPTGTSLQKPGNQPSVPA